ncbi:hypothetical protein pipiens_016766, partial [Culex pipiens pipiens]
MEIRLSNGLCGVSGERTSEVEHCRIEPIHAWELLIVASGLLLSFLNIVINYRALELAFIFLLVWYYCTLTIRESILKVNGSRIKGWWRLHHFISTASAGVLLIWPQGEPWQLFRTQFMYFNVYISLVQYMQFGYQKGV